MDELITNLIKENKIIEAKIHAIKNLFFDKKKFYYYLGLCSIAEKDYESAIKFFNNSIKHGLKHFLLYYNLGTAYLEMNQNHRAKDCFNKSIELNNQYYNNYLNLAYIYLMENDVKSAYRIIKTATSIFEEPKIIQIEKKILKALNI
ncbi:Tetratricopeptide repeat protein [Caloramator mitchellensis]|uniref:Tetratricopeptide repeat protein n=1 Tax=Caloramator mitchellensis TaxID=908809 RepID=A0A0R3JU24_CALMK|nr:tetratricopeptide repeat protein [Caloramator mitchellensis]KRQ87035.1 Tetratricopeptide repeat protein [Caloramator mitchellensis]